MNKTMKLLIIPLLFLFGCEQGIDVSSPPPEASHQYKLIKLPERMGMGVESQTYSMSINGSEDTEFQRSFSYESGNGTVYQFSDLDFYSGAFSGTQNISMTFNTGGAAMEFGPSMQFNVPVEYTYKITGVDLSGVDPTTLTFVYIDSNGNMSPVEYDYVYMDASIGLLKVKNAKLNHFSRYGFVN